MNQSKLVGLVISVTIGIILLATALVPVIQDYNESAPIDYINGGIYFEKADKENVTLAHDGTTYSVNGVAVTADYPFRILSDQLLVENDIVAALDGAATLPFVSDVTSWTATISASAKTITINYTAGGSPVEVTKSYEFCYYNANSGDYVSSAYIPPSYFLNSIDDLVGFGIPYPNYVTMLYQDEIYVKGLVTEYTLNYQLNSIPGINDVSKISTYPTYADAVLGTTDSSFSVWIVPADVTGIKASDESIGNLLLVIPVVILAGMIAIVARVATSRNN